VHEVGRLDLSRLHALLEGRLPEGESDGELRGRGYARVWLEIRDDPERRGILSTDLAALYGPRLLERYPAGGNSPRGVAVAADGGRVAVATYFSGNVVVLSAETGAPAGTVSLGAGRTGDASRRGESIFHDATYCFQGWLSCATCHPAGRVDGLNWDLLNDGMGNPKNTRSLVLSHETPPVMSLGVRSSMEVASAAGFKFIQFREIPDGDLDAVREYLRSLRPAPSPYLIDGKLSAAAKRGQGVFQSKEAGCAACHPAPLYTDMKMYDVGTRGPLSRADAFDTSTLLELWRTGPYLHDGRAATLREILTEFNREDRHGRTSHLSDDEIHALVAFLQSL
jgi:cytochrome c peroxidase